MNTHILIPIKDIDDCIKSSEDVIRLLKDKGKSTEVVRGRLEQLLSLKTDYRQISLDEKDMEAKAGKYYDANQHRYHDEGGNLMDYTDIHDAYKQALKDLI